jgi:hypothetical protein
LARGDEVVVPGNIVGQSEDESPSVLHCYPKVFRCTIAAQALAPRS